MSRRNRNNQVTGRLVTLLLSGLFAGLAGLAIHVFWGPVLQFGYSLIPATAAHAWVGKAIVTLLVAYFGGIGLPIFLSIIALYLLVMAFSE